MNCDVMVWWEEEEVPKLKLVTWSTTDMDLRNLSYILTPTYIEGCEIKRENGVREHYQ
jgi:hypothetical protein